MYKVIRPVIVVLFLLAIAAFTLTYTVRFTETAVLTRFGNHVKTTTEPGLQFKLPYPIHSVTKYDKRLRVLQTRSSTQQMADNSQVIIEAFATWRVADPLVFFQRFSNAGDRSALHYTAAEDILRSSLMSALSETSNYRIDELFTAEPGGTKLPELEEMILGRLVSGEGGAGSGSRLAEYGIEVTRVGINRVLLPESTSGEVIKRMGAGRDRLKQDLESQGQAEATAIRAQAQAAADKIRSFAQRRAAEIRAKGELEAAEYLAAQDQAPDLAVFLQNIELMKDAMAKKFTLVLSASDYGLGIFSPSAMDEGGVLGGGLGAGLDLTGDRRRLRSAEAGE